MSDIRYNGWLHRSGTGGVWQDSSGRVGIGTSVGMNCLINSGPNALTFGTGATPAERVRIDSSGNVLVGTTDTTLYDSTSDEGIVLRNGEAIDIARSGDVQLTLNRLSNEGANIALYQAGGVKATIGTKGSGGLYFGTNGDNERVRITSGGDVNIGGDYTQTDSKVTIIDATKPIAEATLNLQSSSTDGAADTGAVLRFYGHDGSTGRYHSSIKGAKENGTSGNYDGYLSFNTRTNGTTMAERLRIRGDGRVSIASSLAVVGVCTAKQFVPTEYALTNRNFVINGDMQVSQRTTSVSNCTTTDYRTVDRWRCAMGNGGTYTVATVVDGPSGSGFTKCLKLTCTTVDNSGQPNLANADGYIAIDYRMEGRDLQGLAKGTSSAKPLTLSFWVKSNHTGTFNIELVDQDNTRRIGSQYTISSSGTWEKKTFTFAGDTTGSLSNDSNLSMYLRWWIAAGNNYRTGTNSGSWASVTANQRAQSNQNMSGATNRYFALTGVQLEVGSVATPFEHRTYGEELTRCQRYYTRTGVLTGQVGAAYGKAYSTSEMFTTVCFPTSMRAIPTVTTYDNGGTSGAVHKLGNPNITGVSSIDRHDTRGFGRVNKSAAWATGDTDMYSFTWEASAEL